MGCEGPSALKGSEWRVTRSGCSQVASYYHFAGFEDISVADVSPDGWVGQRDPMIVVQARAPG